MSADNPLDRARQRLAARRRERHFNVGVPGWGDELVARVDECDPWVADLITTWTLDAGVDATADLIAAAVTRLYVRTETGELAAIVDPSSGQQLRFDGRFGPALGVPYCTTPRAAVLLAFSEGEPPVVDTAGLAELAAAIQRWHAVNGRQSSRRASSA